MYIFDTQEKTDPRKLAGTLTGFFWVMGKPGKLRLRSFLGSGKAWTFSSTVCVD